MTTLGIAGLAVLAFGGLLFILGMFVLGAGSVASMGKMFYSMLKNFSKSPSERLRDSDGRSQTATLRRCTPSSQE